ncbi:unnamed protein product [Protopolystoma xenopodis]|uniref:Uncharacterized protein n=1 Tax=Protopolystoma xenopodis TaxID=117903 RepID=A0A3S5A581_9PLAT|nr:unnamed protein product [Protopolystoma xenopodis]
MINFNKAKYVPAPQALRFHPTDRRTAGENSPHLVEVSIRRVSEENGPLDWYYLVVTPDPLPADFHTSRHGPSEVGSRTVASELKVQTGPVTMSSSPPLASSGGSSEAVKSRLSSHAESNGAVSSHLPPPTSYNLTELSRYADPRLWESRSAPYLAMARLVDNLFTPPRETVLIALGGSARRLLSWPNSLAAGTGELVGAGKSDNLIDLTTETDVSHGVFNKALFSGTLYRAALRVCSSVSKCTFVT